MKFQFKEGQWFDVRKLTDWQKQWCLENLEFLPTTEADFKEEDFNFWMYSVWTGVGDVFCSTSEHCCEPENEITFNDFYWEDEESFDNLVYVEPNDDCKIKIPNLSNEQKIFLNDSLNWSDDDRFLTLNSSNFKHLRYCATEKSWWLSICSVYECSEADISFNDIFKEVNQD